MTVHHHQSVDRCEWSEDSHGLWGAVILGIGILTLGVVLILDNFGTIDGSVLVPYWPILLMVFGVSQLLQSSARRRVVCGLTWVAVGAILVLQNLGVITVGLSELWPLILLIIGGDLLYRGLQRRTRRLEAPQHRVPRRWRELGKETRHDTQK